MRSRPRAATPQTAPLAAAGSLDTAVLYPRLLRSYLALSTTSFKHLFCFTFASLEEGQFLLGPDQIHMSETIEINRGLHLKHSASPKKRNTVTGVQDRSEVESMIQRYLELAASALKDKSAVSSTEQDHKAKDSA